MSRDPFDPTAPVIPWGMTEEEHGLAQRLYRTIQESQHESDRSKQAQSFVVGVSDLGYCSERLRRMLDRQVPDEEQEMLKAFIGTWLGAGVEAAWKTMNPESQTQGEVRISLRGAKYTYEIPGHPDILDGNTVLDVKSAMRLSGVARHGFSDQQKRFQRHVYGLAAFEAGLLGDIALEEIRVGNVWIDRSGQDPLPLVKIEPFDPEVVEEAVRWLDGVVYAWENGEEAEKEPAREVCESTCGYWRTCRALDTDVTGRITDSRILDAVDMHLTAADLGRESKALAESAKDILLNVSGSTGTHTVRTINVNGTDERAGYKRVQVSKIRESRKRAPNPLP